MNRYLFLLRHAEAEPDAGGGDIDRPLSARGIKSIESVGCNLRLRGERVQKIYSSTAVRAAQTARGICSYLEYGEKDIAWRPDLYLASPGDLLAFLTSGSLKSESLMLIGHNPGLQGLMAFLAVGESLPPDRSLATATLAKLEIHMEWESLQPECARLIYLLKPQERTSR